MTTGPEEEIEVIAVKEGEPSSKQHKTPNLEEKGVKGIKPLPNQEKPQYDGLNASKDITIITPHNNKEPEKKVLLLDKKKEKVCSSQLFNNLSEKEKVIFTLYDTPNLTRSAIAKSLLCVISVISVISVINNSNNSNNTFTAHTPPIPKIEEIENKLTTILKREIDNHKTIKVDKSQQPYTYSLTEKGIDWVEKEWKEFKDNVRATFEKEESERATKTHIELSKEYFERPDIYKQFTPDKKFIVIDYIDLTKYDPNLATDLSNNPEEVIEEMKIAIESLDLENEYSIQIKNLSKIDELNITNIRAEHLDKLKGIIGEIRSRSQTAILILSAKFECPSCANVINILQQDTTFKEPSKCVCGRKGKFKVISKETTDLLHLTVSDLYENLESGEVPEEINLYLSEDNFDFSRLNEGDRVRIVGIVKVIDVVAKSGKKTTTQTKIIKGVSIEKLNDDYTKVFINKEDEKEFEEIKKNPIKWHNKVLFSDLDNVATQTKMATLSLYGDLNILSVGDFGRGKSEAIKRICKVSLRGKFVDCISATHSGVIGTTTKNQFTNKYSLDGGVFRPMNPNGKVGLDELNRDMDFSIQKTILGIMANRRLNLHKANVRIDVECKVSISASVNPFLPEYDKNRTAHENFNILAPLWDRFDFILYFSNNPDFNDEKLVIKCLKNNKEDFEIDDKDLRLIKKYQIKAQLIKVKFDDESYKKLSKVFNEFYTKVDGKASYRKISTMKRLLEAICRLHHRNKPIDEDFKFMTDLISELAMTKSEFLSLQDNFTKETEMVK